MQDSLAPKRKRVFRERPCVDCGEPFIPRSGRAIRCDGCRDGLPRQTCQKDDCGRLLRRDNRIGYCEEHKYATARAAVRYCTEAPCDATLRIDNESGYCPSHAYLSEGSLASRERYYARQREESRMRYLQRPLCELEDCGARLRSDNHSRRCREHVYLPLDLAECEVDGCPKRLNTNNRSGRCQEHQGLYWAPDAPKCRAQGCGKTLHGDNVLGYCHEHRRQSPEWREYQRTYYLSRQDELVEYARFYREVYADEHRAYSRAHYAEHGRISPEAQRAAAARRRQRATHGMDDLDRWLSAEYRKAIADDPCFYCGDPETHHVDHFFPIAKGGTDVWFNLVAACRDCNLSKFTTCGTAFLLRAGLLSVRLAA